MNGRKVLFIMMALVVTMGIIIIVFLSKNAVVSDSVDVKESEINGSEGNVRLIALTEDGFRPERITIKKGTNVRFTSARNTFFWPASDLHPTHEIYSEFDPKEPIGSDGVWSFTFDRVGSWTYHDHLAPYFVGEIIVVP
jgi:plastocyanin